MSNATAVNTSKIEIAKLALDYLAKLQTIGADGYLHKIAGENASFEDLFNEVFKVVEAKVANTKSSLRIPD